ncbi:MAG: hypothetical protein GEU94_00935 [Micromonosporaceae bacterium]|nr:hypothetical protein [Micromonosporaceae bacterium]
MEPQLPAHRTGGRLPRDPRRIRRRACAHPRRPVRRLHRRRARGAAVGGASRALGAAAGRPGGPAAARALGRPGSRRPGEHRDGRGAGPGARPAPRRGGGGGAPEVGFPGRIPAVAAGDARGQTPLAGLISNGRLETAGGDEVYGMFLNTLPLRVTSAAETWQGLVADVFADETAMWAHRRFPLPALQRLAGADAPLIDNTFNYLDFYTVDQQAVDLRRTADNSPNEFPLVVTVGPGHIEFTVRESRVSSATAARLGEVYRAVLSAMSRDPEGAVTWDVPEAPSGHLAAPPVRTPPCDEPDPRETSAPSTGRPTAAGAPAAVGDDLERVIAGVWAELFEVAAVSPDDDFVALGGHSLTAMRVAAKLRADHAIDVSPREVLRVRTVAALAATIRAMTGPAGGGDVDGESTLVWLRESGKQAPLVCVHPGGGGIHWYRELTEALPAEQPVAAIRHPASVDPELAGSSVEELADRYLVDLRAATGSGPYHLLGWCGGAPVTWELSRRLAESGERVRLVLLDPALEGLACADNDVPEPLRVLRRCELLLQQLRSEPDHDRAAERRAEAVRLLHEVVDDDRAHAMIKPDELGADWVEQVRVWRRLAESRLAYRFGRYPGDADLILGDELVEGEHVALGEQDYDAYLAHWRGLATGTVRSHRAPGSHVGVLRPPHVAQLAALVERILSPDAPG